ncbi:MAG: hypothetical protein K2H42_03070 [Alistipes sp.]|nr:hypothetical protein [Alistipes sp.]
MEEALDEMHVVGEVVNVLADESVLGSQGRVDMGKLRLIIYDSVSCSYRIAGEAVGQAFHDGKKAACDGVSEA